jgi:hypothetical protein
MSKSVHELRKHPRYPAELRLKVRLPSGDVDTFTSMVSLRGFSARLPAQVLSGLESTFVAHLPDGQAVVGDAITRTSMPDGMTGFEIMLDPAVHAAWASFIDEEGSTGSLWRMIGRYTSGHGDTASARAVVYTEPKATVPVIAQQALAQQAGPPARDTKNATDDIEDTKKVALRFHTVGENGEAYRLCFATRPSTIGIDSDLVSKVEGFAKVAEKAVSRILDEPVVIRMSENAMAQEVRVAELSRGGYAYVQGSENLPAGLVSLVVGELILVEVDGQPVFPRFTEMELEQIACDTFPSDLTRPLFPTTTTPARHQETPAPAPDTTRAAPAPITFETPPPVMGVEAVRRAQDTAERRERRVYGTRQIDLFPAVWARAKIDGCEVMGPTMRDGERVLVLVLVGPGAPRVVKLDERSEVTLLARH